MRKINRIIIHCTATNNPKQWSLEAVKDLHTSPKSKLIKWGEYNTHGNNWSDVGYHFLVDGEGKIEIGRPLWKVGAHTKGYNRGSIGIALHGDYDFSPNQLVSAGNLVSMLRKTFQIQSSFINGHSDLDPSKTCPNLYMLILKQIFVEKL